MIDYTIHNWTPFEGEYKVTVLKSQVSKKRKSTWVRKGSEINPHFSVGEKVTGTTNG